jgi:peptidyl-prolyl cis-trans isomerase SurA
MKSTLLSTLLLFTLNSNAVLLDKTISIVNDSVITLSQVKAIKRNLRNYKKVSPFLFADVKKTKKDITLKKVQGILIRKKLSDIGYVISDEQVEQEITSLEKSQRFTRDDLLYFLKDAKINFDQYFELKREEIEYRIFISNIIRPLISISDQDIKNAYYKKNRNNKRLNFKYTLVDFSLNKSKFKKGMLSSFTDVLIKFQSSGVLPQNFKSVETNLIEDISADGLTNSLKKSLKNIDEGEFTKPVLLGGSYHVFFIKSKDLTESSNFAENKELIRNQLFGERLKDFTKNWYDNESKKYFVKFHI